MANKYVAKARTWVCDTTGVVIKRATNCVMAITYVGDSSAAADAHFEVATLDAAGTGKGDVFSESYATAKNFVDYRHGMEVMVDGGYYVTVPAHGKIYIQEK